MLIEHSISYAQNLALAKMRRSEMVRTVPATAPLHLGRNQCFQYSVNPHQSAATFPYRLSFLDNLHPSVHHNRSNMVHVQDLQSRTLNPIVCHPDQRYHFAVPEGPFSSEIMGRSRISSDDIDSDSEKGKLVIFFL